MGSQVNGWGRMNSSEKNNYTQFGTCTCINPLVPSTQNQNTNSPFLTQHISHTILKWININK